MQSLTLKKDAERRIHAGHLWIFSNDIDTTQSPLKNYAVGELIVIQTQFKKKVAIGYINPHCLLCIRVLTQDTKTIIDTAFFVERLQAAKAKRSGLFFDNFCRMVFGESDRLPGVVIDQYNDIVVVQINTAGMEQLKSALIDAINTVFEPKSIVLKCDSTERKNEGLDAYTEVLGDALPDTIMIKENNCSYETSLITGQKTGWFYDHRFNRARIASYCHNKKVLDVFSYCGAFSIPCAKNGALSVTAVDRSQPALELLQKNAEHNGLHNINTLCGDALECMQDLYAKQARFDVIVLDPPALIKRKKEFAAGEKHYQKLNEAALRLLNPNGILLSASCSMHMSSADLLNAIRKAGISAQKELSVLEHCHQGPDHPIHPAIIETSYLKGFIFAVQ